MRIVMTLIVHNEEDILDANLVYHFAQGVHHVLAIDDRSTDATGSILDRHARGGRLTRIARPEGEMYAAQSRWLTLLARRAATEHQADWVINNDADEFWWPLRGTLVDAFATVPGDCGVVVAPRTDFIIGDESQDGRVERITLREATSPISAKVAHRGSPHVVVGTGSHHALTDPTLDELAWSGKEDREYDLRASPVFPIRVFHFPVRRWAFVEPPAGGAPPALARDPVLNRMRRSPEHSAVDASALPGRRAEAIAEHVRQGAIVEDRRLAAFLAREGLVEGSQPPAETASVDPPRPDDEATEVMRLVVDALLSENHYLRGRRQRLKGQVESLASNRWLQMGRAVGNLRRTGRARRKVR
ncbi:MAG: glycosyltransferase family 2 protein [Solirubrobacterales bacterium]